MSDQTFVPGVSAGGEGGVHAVFEADGAQWSVGGGGEEGSS